MVLLVVKVCMCKFGVKTVFLSLFIGCVEPRVTNGLKLKMMLKLNFGSMVTTGLKFYGSV